MFQTYFILFGHLGSTAIENARKFVVWQRRSNVEPKSNWILISSAHEKIGVWTGPWLFCFLLFVFLFLSGKRPSWETFLSPLAGAYRIWRAVRKALGTSLGGGGSVWAGLEGWVTAILCSLWNMLLSGYRKDEAGAPRVFAQSGGFRWGPTARRVGAWLHTAGPELAPVHDGFHRGVQTTRISAACFDLQRRHRYGGARFVSVAQWQPQRLRDASSVSRHVLASPAEYFCVRREKIDLL